MSNTPFTGNPEPGGYFAAPPGPRSADQPTSPYGTPSPFAPSPQFGAPPGYVPNPQFGGAAQPTRFGTPPPTYAPAPAALPPSPRRPTTMLIGVGAVVALIAFAAVGFMIRHAGSHSLSTPPTAAGYNKLVGAPWDSLTGDMLSQLRDDGAKSPVAAYYGTAGAPVAMILATKTDGHSTEERDGMLSAMQADLRSPLAATDPGKLGGEMSCAMMQVTSTGQSPICYWTDKDTLGVVGLYQGSLDEAPALARQFRAAVEH
jgi:hypothetical protein